MKKLKEMIDGAAVAKELGRRYLRRTLRSAKNFAEEVRYDVEAFRQRDPAARSNAEILLL